MNQKYKCPIKICSSLGLGAVSSTPGGAVRAQRRSFLARLSQREPVSSSAQTAAPSQMSYQTAPPCLGAAPSEPPSACAAQRRQ